MTVHAFRQKRVNGHAISFMAAMDTQAAYSAIGRWRMNGIDIGDIIGYIITLAVGFSGAFFGAKHGVKSSIKRSVTNKKVKVGGDFHGGDDNRSSFVN
jgi:hypothetical protein